MKKLIILLLITILLAGCMSPQEQQSYVVDLRTDFATEHKVTVSEIELSFLQSCAFDIGSINTIVYVQVKGSNTIYQYTSDDCEERKLSNFTKTIYSEDGKLPESFEK